MIWIRHLLSILALPFLVAVVVPVWIARSWSVGALAPASLWEWLGVVFGTALLLVGLALFLASLRRFATEGQGTLAPWDPPRRLVLRGPYRYVRNPMISGVIFALAGEALLLRSLPHLVWAVCFALINAVYIPLLEEPQLELRFGDEYLHYKRHVRRFLPRVRPWQGERE